MTDIHSHILPGVDDGSPSWEVTDRMLAAYVAEGVDTVVCTPHQGAGLFRPELIKERFAMLEERAKDLPLTLRLGAEIYFYNGMQADLAAGRLLTLGGSPYVLVEFSTRSDVYDVPDAVYALAYAGYKPVVAHIERYPYLDESACGEIVAAGGCIQVNASSFAKKEYARVLKRLFKGNFVDFIASDCHDDSRRRIDFSHARKYVGKKYPSLYDKYFGKDNIFGGGVTDRPLRRRGL